MSNYLTPKLSVAAESVRLYKHMQTTGMTIVQDVVGLRYLANNYQFSNVDEAVCDQLLTDISSQEIQMTLLVMKNLTLDMALETAKTIEVAQVAVNKLGMRAVDLSLWLRELAIPRGPSCPRRELSYFGASELRDGRHCYRK